MIAPTTIDELQEHLGEVGASCWHPVTQEDVNRFADATGDDQWIHTDVATTLTFERPGGDRPVCVARLLIRVQS
jgi:acyl dehydratase